MWLIHVRMFYKLQFIRRLSVLHYSKILFNIIQVGRIIHYTEKIQPQIKYNFFTN